MQQNVTLNIYKSLSSNNVAYNESNVICTYLWLLCSIMVQSLQTADWHDSQYKTNFSFLWTLQKRGLANSPGRHERTSSRLNSGWSTVSRERRCAVVQKLQRNLRHKLHLDTGASLLMQFSQLIWFTVELSSAITVSMFWANKLVCRVETPSPGIYDDIKWSCNRLSLTIKHTPSADEIGVSRSDLDDSLSDQSDKGKDCYKTVLLTVRW